MKAMWLKVNKLQCISKHIPISISILSNANYYEDPKCFVNTNNESFLSDMMEYHLEICETNLLDMTQKYHHIFI